MPLNRLYLFKNVKITRDYSVTHDMDNLTWFRYLVNYQGAQTGDPSPPQTVTTFPTVINYYRLPDVIRIEGNYDELRTATYGVLTKGGDAGQDMPSFEYIFFWVDSVRLVKQRTEIVTVGAETIVKDVVELSVTPDIWSNKFTDCSLYDSYVARRHEDRWYRDHSDPDDPDAWVYHPRYFPNAADDVGGAYTPEGDPQDISPKIEMGEGSGQWYNPLYIVVNVLDKNGVQRMIVGCTMVDGEHNERGCTLTSDNDNMQLASFGLIHVMNGSLFSSLSIDAQYVQSILVTPDIKILRDATEWNGTNFEVVPSADIAVAFTTAHTGSVPWIFSYMESKTYISNMNAGIYGDAARGVTPVAPQWQYADTPSGRIYKDKNEPMLFRSPARARKIITGMGGTIIDVPDIDAFADVFTQMNLVDLNTGLLVIFGGTDIEKANAIGNMGTAEMASLPIFESAWKNYEAIQKTGDDISFHAKQVSTVIGTITGAAGGLAGGAITGAMTTANPIGAVGGAAIGAVGGVVGGATQYWSNSENLRAKHETIRNSPCVVVNGGSGLAAYVKNFIDLHYMTLKLDDTSFNKLRTQYYYYGYNVNMVIPGTIDTKIRKYFDYIETRGARIRGNVNAEEAQGIAAAFDRGVRIYHGFEGYQRIGAGMSMENPERAFLE
jgi:hypothetical protein